MLTECSKETDGPTIQWQKIQDILDDSSADVLVLLDCCNAALVAKSATKKLDGKFEVLAASAEGVKTPRPGPRSFTNLLLNELKRELKTDSKIDVSLLHGALTKAKGITGTTANQIISSISAANVAG